MPFDGQQFVKVVVIELRTCECDGMLKHLLCVFVFWQTIKSERCDVITPALSIRKGEIWLLIQQSRGNLAAESEQLREREQLRACSESLSLCYLIVSNLTN